MCCCLVLALAPGLDDVCVPSTHVCFGQNDVKRPAGRRAASSEQRAATGDPPRWIDHGSVCRVMAMHDQVGRTSPHRPSRSNAHGGIWWTKISTRSRLITTRTYVCVPVCFDHDACGARRGPGEPADHRGLRRTANLAAVPDWLILMPWPWVSQVDRGVVYQSTDRLDTEIGHSRKTEVAVADDRRGDSDTNGPVKTRPASDRPWRRGA
jgi:hypothetical protein